METKYIKQRKFVRTVFEMETILIFVYFRHNFHWILGVILNNLPELNFTITNISINFENEGEWSEFYKWKQNYT